HSCAVPIEEAEEIYSNSIAELKKETKDKIANFILRERPELAIGHSGRPDIKTIGQKVDDWYEAHLDQLTPGKELLGRIKNHIQTTLKFPPNQILQVSPALFRHAFQDLIHPSTTEKDEV